jgi:tetratricopeptide (TPR) repeat protein
MFGFSFGFNKEKSRAKAEGYLQQNKLQNAVTEYEKILQVEPRDFAILNTVGDIYSRLGQNEKAIERFRVVGESYAAEGFTLKSIAMYKKIAKLDPNGLATLEKLAELYRKQGLVSDARSMLLQAAEAYTRKGQSKETLRLLKQLVLFDPENVQVITRTADLMTQGGQKKEALEMLSQTAAKLIERHALEPAQKLLDRLITLDRGNLRAQQLRAQVTFELGDTEKAAELYEAIPDLDSHAEGLNNLLSAYLKLGKLDEALVISRKLVSVHHDADGALKVAARLYKENDTLGAISLYNEFSTEVIARDKEDVLAHLHGAVSRMRNDPAALQILYALFRRAGEDSMIPEVLELLAHAYVQSDQLERARDTYKELIELEPESSAHLQGYRQVCARLNPVAPPPAPVGETKPDDGPHTMEEFLGGDEPALPVQSYSPPVEETIATALTEADLCETFSSKTGGVAALELALQSAPEDLRLNRALGLLYQQAGDSARATRCYSTMQRVLEHLGETQAAEHFGVLANAGQTTTTTWEAKGSEFTARDFDIAADSGDADGSAEEIDLSSEWESVFQDASTEPAAPLSLPAHADLPTAAPVASPGAVSELIEEVRFCIAQQIWDEAESAISRLAAACPEHPELPALRAQLPLEHPAPVPAEPTISATHPPAYAPVEVIEVGEDNLLTPAPPSVAQLPPATDFNLDSLAAELDFELGDSFEPEPLLPPPAPQSTQLPAEAAAPMPMPAPFFTPPALALPAPVPAFAHPEPNPTPAPQPQRSPELLPAMAAAVEPPSAPEPVLAPSVFGDLLQNFERDLAAPDDNDNDPETHFNLGIAFREMGLLDEAIGELQKVCRMAGHGLNPARAQDAYIWLATCFVEKAVPEAALKWFLRALEAAPDEESRTAVNYELASAYEAAGRKREALDHFMEVYGTNIDYRDVANRIRDLRSTV